MTIVWPVVAATGHRQRNLPPGSEAWVREKLAAGAVWLRDERGCRTAISGLALGVDTWWARAVLDAGLELWAYVPFPQQPDPWPRAAKAEWRRLLNRAAKVEHLGDLDGLPPGRRKAMATALLHARNGQMLDDADAVIAVLDPAKTGGGTVSAVRSARALGLPIVHLNPRARTVNVVEPGTGRMAP